MKIEDFMILASVLTASLFIVDCKQEKKATVSLLLVIQPNNNLFWTCFEFLDLKNVVQKNVFTLFAISCASVTTFGGFIFCGEPFDNIHLLFEKIISSGPEIESTAKVFMSF